MTTSEAARYDAVVVGGGPAGATIGRLLARWGHSVLILAAPPPRHALAESLPPSIQNIFHVLEITDEIARAGFAPNLGNTAWWGTTEPRVESYANGAHGYHVERRTFDAMLLDLAEQAGARVLRGVRARAVDLSENRVHFGADGIASTSFILGCTGRVGFVARQVKRVWDARYRTVALCGTWSSATGWDADPAHTLIEAYQDGWAWSVPLSQTRRFVSFMVDGNRGSGAEEVYRAELGKTRAFRRLFAASTLEGTPWGADSSLYYSPQCSGASFLLVGDAASFIDPLSSFGVKKALISAWTGAVAVHTCISRPEMAEHALALYNERELQTYADHVRQAAHHFGELNSVYASPYWRDRAVAPAEFSLYDEAGLWQALDELRAKPQIHLRPAAELCHERRPTIRGNEVVLTDRVIVPGLPSGVSYLQGVNLAKLVEMAPQFTQVADLFEAYDQQCPPVGLPSFLSALSFLIAKRVLVEG